MMFFLDPSRQLAWYMATIQHRYLEAYAIATGAEFTLSVEMDHRAPAVAPCASKAPETHQTGAVHLATVNGREIDWREDG